MTKDGEKAVIDTLLKGFSPRIQKLIQKILPSELTPFFFLKTDGVTVADKALLQILANLGKKIFQKEIDNGVKLEPKEVIQKLSSKLMDLVKNSFEGLDRKKKQGHPVSVESLHSLALDFIELITPEAPFLLQFIKRHPDRFCKPISEKLFEVYQARPINSDHQEYQKRLSSILGEGNEQTVEQLYNLCKHLASTSRQKIMEELQKEEAVIKQFGELQQNSDGIKILANGVNAIFSVDDHNISWIGNEAESAFAMTLFKGVVHLLELVPIEKRDPKKILGEVLHQCLLIGQPFFPSILDAIKDKSDKEETAIKKISSSIEPLVEKFTEILTGKDEAEVMGLKTFSKKLLKSKMASFLGGAIFTISTAMNKDAKNRKNLEEIYGSEYPSKFCHMLGQMGGQGALYFLRENEEEISKDWMKKIAPWCLAGDKTLENLSILQKMLQGFIHEIGHSRSKEMRKAIGFLSAFVESTILSLLHDMTLFIQKEELQTASDDPSVLEKGMLKVIEHLKNHFRAIVKAKRSLKKTKPEKITREDLIKIFEKEGILHSAAKSKSGQKVFAETWTKRILDLFEVENTHLSLPSLFRTPFWEKLEKDIFPGLVKNFFNTTNQPETINNALLSLFNEIDAPHKSSGNMRKFNDDYQKKLEENLAGLAKAIIDLQPAFLAQIGLKSQRMKKATGQAIGEPLRSALRPEGKPLSVIGISDKIMEATVEKFLPCRWNNEKHRYEYLRISPGKEPVYVEQPNLARLFPRDQIEKISAKVILENERKRVEKEVPEKMGKVIRNETSRMVKEIFDSLWNSIKSKIILLIQKIFGRFANRAQKIIMPILGILIGLPLWIVLTIFRYFVWFPIRSILRLYIASQTRMRAGDVELKIHDNLIYNIAEDLLPKPKSQSAPNQA